MENEYKPLEEVMNDTTTKMVVSYFQPDTESLIVIEGALHDLVSRVEELKSASLSMQGVLTWSKIYVALMSIKDSTESALSDIDTELELLRNL